MPRPPYSRHPLGPVLGLALGMVVALVIALFVLGRDHLRLPTASGKEPYSH